MPTRWFVPVAGIDPSAVRPEHLHALVCDWLERDASITAHRANRKAFTVRSWRHDVADRTVGFELTLLDDRGRQRFESSVAVSTRVRLGQQRGQVGSPVLQAEASWGRLATQAPASEFSFSFLSPTTFRSGDRCMPFPLPTLVFGHYRRIWRTFGPPELCPDVDLKEAGLVIRAFDLRTRDVVIRSHRYTGFVGEITFGTDRLSDQARSALAALAALAEFAGTGANTTAGMGSTRWCG